MPQGLRGARRFGRVSLFGLGGASSTKPVPRQLGQSPVKSQPEQVEPHGQAPVSQSRQG